jgi:ABC-type ATPase involved in cell division
MQRSTAINLVDVYLRSDHDDPIFEGLELELKAGESVVVVGAAASGKTSLVELLIGARNPDAGIVEVLGTKLGRRRRPVRKVRRKVGGVGGLFDLVPSYTVAENIALPLVLANLPLKFRRERLMKLLAEFSLLKRANDYPHQLTRVEGLLVQLARATIADQPLVLLDEPAAGLDPATRERIQEYLRKLTVSGCSMLILTSDGSLLDLPEVATFELLGGKLQ